MQYREAITKLKQNVMDEEYYQNEMNRYKQAPVLLIDDLFKGKITEADQNIMFEIANHRYMNLLPMIVSSEFDVDRLTDGEFEAVGSRIIHRCKGRIVEFKGKDLNYRLR
jgi:DNA replication protein DnaC